MLLQSLSVVCGLASAVYAAHDIGSHHKAKAHADRAHSDAKRDDSGTFSGTATWFEVGLGACGQYSQDSDFMVALNAPQYGSGGNCGKTITISANGKSTNAVILDECPPCAWGSLDLSPSLFSFFYDQGVGTFQMSWVFADAAPPPPPAPTTTSTPAWTPPPTTSTPAWTSTTSSTPTTSSVQSSTTDSASLLSSSSITSSTNGTITGSSSLATASSSAATTTTTPGSADTGGDNGVGGAIYQQQAFVANMAYLAAAARSNEDL